MTATDKFIDGIGKLLSSNPLTAERDIRYFLNLLVSDERLKAAVSAAAENFCFEEEFERAFYDKAGLPKQENKTASLVLGLLFSFDTRKIALTDFLAFLYPDLETSDAYRRFLTDCIQPFAESFASVLNGGSSVEDAGKRICVPDKMNEEIARAVNELNAFIGKKKPDETAESFLLSASNGLTYALKYGDPILTKNAFFGLCCALRLHAIKTSLIDDIARLLKIYGVL